MKIFLSAGEPSGDLHGANLIRDLKSSNPDIEFVGFGGPRMRSEGCNLFHDMTQLAVMFVLNVLLNIHKFYGLYRQAKQYFDNHEIDAVVLIDYPGFNWWIAGLAKKHGVPVFYYGAPQMWAWASWRIKKMRRLVDHVLCKLPFEAEWYKQRNCNATYVGHPYFDELSSRQLDRSFMIDIANSKGAMVAILPGSRRQEIQLNLRDFLKAAENIQEQLPDTQFVVASYNEEQAELAREIISEGDFKPTVHAGKTAELIEAADCCMACSGSVSLELLYHSKPSVVLYRVSRFAFAVQNMLRKVKFVTLVNLLAADDPFGPSLALFDPTAPRAEQVPFPEYLTCEDKTDWIAYHLIQWLHDDAAYAKRVRLLERLRDRYASAGASKTAAD
ncbi:MAG: lipid-A-disaccharide synthase, partial [bacterium]|nr:lipid-A-disaccharide synthase [bacterium]